MHLRLTAVSFLPDFQPFLDLIFRHMTNDTVTPSGAKAESKSRDGVGWLVISGILLAALFVFRCKVTTERFLDPDELVQLNAAYFVTQGETLYGSFFENHPPLTVLLLQPIVRSTDDPETMIKRARLLMLGFTMAILIAVARLAFLVGGRSGAVIAAALLFSHSFFFQKTLEVRPDVPALFFFVLALVVLVRGVSSESWYRLILGGALFSVAGLFTPKVIYAAFGATLAASFSGNAVNRPGVRSMRKLGLIILGAALVGVLASAEMYRRGMLTGFLTDVIGTSVRMTIDDPAMYRWRFLSQMATINLGTCLLALLGMVVLAKKRMNVPTGLTPVVFTSLATGFLGLFLNQAPLRQLYLPFLPQVVVLASVGILTVVRAIHRRFPRPLASAALLAILLSVVLPPTLSVRNDLEPMEEQLTILNKVLDLTSHHDRVFDCFTGLYLTRLPAYRYFYLNTDVQRLFTRDELRREVRQALRQPEVKLVITDPDFSHLPRSIHRLAGTEFAPVPDYPFPAYQEVMWNAVIPRLPSVVLKKRLRGVVPLMVVVNKLNIFDARRF